MYVWWGSKEPEGVFVYGEREERGFGVDLLAGLEEGGLDAAGFVEAWSVVEAVLAVGGRCSFDLFFILIVLFLLGWGGWCMV